MTDSNEAFSRVVIDARLADQVWKSWFLSLHQLPGLYSPYPFLAMP